MSHIDVTLQTEFKTLRVAENIGVDVNASFVALDRDCNSTVRPVVIVEVTASSLYEAADGDARIDDRPPRRMAPQRESSAGGFGVEEPVAGTHRGIGQVSSSRGCFIQPMLLLLTSAEAVQQLFPRRQIFHGSCGRARAAPTEE